MKGTLAAAAILLIMTPAKLPYSEGCELVKIVTNMSKSDMFGVCRGRNVETQGCSGSCYSETIRRFDLYDTIRRYPVCTFAGYRNVTKRLDDCVGDVLPETRNLTYPEPIDCGCLACTISNTFCGHTRKRGRPSPSETPVPIDLSNVISPTRDEGRTKWSQIIPPFLTVFHAYP